MLKKKKNRKKEREENKSSLASPKVSDSAHSKFPPESYPDYIPVKKPKTNKKVFVDSCEIPSNYNTTSLRLMARDPYWIHAYWEIAPSAIAEIRRNIGDDFNSSAYVLRMYDVTCKDFNGDNANHWFDIDVGPHTNNRYINLWSDNVSYCADIGIRSPSGRFFTLARSNIVTTPREGLSGRFDMIWMEVKDDQKTQPFVMAEIQRRKARRLLKSKSHRAKKLGRKILLTEDDIRNYYLRLFPLLKIIKSSRSITELGNKMLDSENQKDEIRLENSFFQGMSPTLSQSQFYKKLLSGASEELMKGASEFAKEISNGGASEREQKQRKFFFEIGTELIVYGRTEPDATVWLGNKEVKLRSDGTFTLRFALPDGKIPLDFVAQSFDKVDIRRISTSVERTKTIHAP